MSLRSHWINKETKSKSQGFFFFNYQVTFLLFVLPLFRGACQMMLTFRKGATVHDTDVRTVRFFLLFLFLSSLAVHVTVYSVLTQTASTERLMQLWVSAGRTTRDWTYLWVRGWSQKNTVVKMTSDLLWLIHEGWTQGPVRFKIGTSGLSLKAVSPWKNYKLPSTSSQTWKRKYIDLYTYIYIYTFVCIYTYINN